MYAARLVGLPIFDPQGDQVGKVRDLVVAIRSEGSQPRVLGMVAEVVDVALRAAELGRRLREAPEPT